MSTTVPQDVPTGPACPCAEADPRPTEPCDCPPPAEPSAVRCRPLVRRPPAAVVTGARRVRGTTRPAPLGPRFTRP